MKFFPSFHTQKKLDTEVEKLRNRGNYKFGLMFLVGLSSLLLLLINFFGNYSLLF